MPFARAVVRCRIPLRRAWQVPLSILRVRDSPTIEADSPLGRFVFGIPMTKHAQAMARIPVLQRRHRGALDRAVDRCFAPARNVDLLLRPVTESYFRSRTP